MSGVFVSVSFVKDGFIRQFQVWTRDLPNYITPDYDDESSRIDEAIWVTSFHASHQGRDESGEVNHSPNRKLIFAKHEKLSP